MKNIVVLSFMVLIAIGMLLLGTFAYMVDDIANGDEEEKFQRNSNSYFIEEEEGLLGSTEPADETVEEKNEVPPSSESNEEEYVDERKGPTYESGSYVTHDSPEIYFHVAREVTFDISVHIEKGVTLTIPNVEMDNSASWNDILVSTDGSIRYEDETYDLLYYEGIFVEDYGPSNQGWVLSRENGQLSLNGIPVNEEITLEFLRYKMISSGLMKNEVVFLLDRIVENDMLSFDTQYLYLRYVPQEAVDMAIQIDAPDEFTIMRRHFLFEASNEEVELDEPEFKILYEEDLIIHETAVNRI